MKLKGIFLSVATLLLLLLKFNGAVGQSAADSTSLYKVETTDGNEYIGTITLEAADYIQLKTARLGSLMLSKSDIRSLTPINQDRIRNGQFWFDNPQATRYLFSPNGYGLKKGEGYYQNVLVILNQVSYGITDKVSIGLGTLPLFLFGSSYTPVWLLPKVSLPITKDKFNLGAGALIGTGLGESNGGYGIVYGISTFGSKDQNLSLGLGYGYADGGWGKAPTITISGLIRTGVRGYFLTENYIISTGDGSMGLLSVGGRRIIKKVGLDYGLIAPISSDIDTFLAIPFLGLTVPFGKGKTRY
ncbi:hypothetical protein [Adhaeribacter aquaticus]|uniref:hypothetical protein n=1 Tax=Adhaeribacter aquaticus TaxID=299567 RepID=UPI0003FC22EF|nr:hypothetical protein [Adhaeribacter aquaticus]